MQKLTVHLLTPQGLVYEGEADSLVLPGSGGFLGVLPSHARLINEIVEGPLTLKNGAEEKLFSVGRGFMEVDRNHVSLLSEEVTGGTKAP